ncbi:MAG: hypothetical protein F8N39_15195 [Clostridiaceae bacterium]|nr:hypothetical protein [Clostridiaceae bacterium]
MRDIQEIMKEMENLTQNQIAVSLSESEKAELLNSINADISSPSLNSPVGDFCATPIPTVTPPTCIPDNACGSQSFCCMIVVPSGLTVNPDQAHAAVVTKDLTVIPNGQCTTKIGNCTIILNKATINGCAEVFVSLGVKDRCGNCTFLCCTDFICLCEKDIICCTLPSSNTVKFIIGPLTATKVTTTGGCEGQQVWKVTGSVSFTCDNC